MNIYNTDENVHEEMYCPKCHHLLMVGDVENLPYKAKERIYEQVFLNYLKSRLKPSQRFDMCDGCKSYYVIDCDEHGVFRCHNNECRFLFCTVCKKRVMSNNELDFKQHEVNCWNYVSYRTNPQRKYIIFTFLVLPKRHLILIFVPTEFTEKKIYSEYPKLKVMNSKSKSRNTTQQCGGERTSS